MADRSQSYKSELVYSYTRAKTRILETHGGASSCYPVWMLPVNGLVLGILSQVSPDLCNIVQMGISRFAHRTDLHRHRQSVAHDNSNINELLDKITIENVLTEEQKTYLDQI